MSHQTIVFFNAVVQTGIAHSQLVPKWPNSSFPKPFHHTLEASEASPAKMLIQGSTVCVGLTPAPW
jgi:hypothetical protein